MLIQASIHAHKIGVRVEFVPGFSSILTFMLIQMRRIVNIKNNSNNYNSFFFFSTFQVRFLTEFCFLRKSVKNNEFIIIF